MTKRSHVQTIKRWDYIEAMKITFAVSRGFLIYLVYFESLIDSSILMGKGLQYPKSQCIKANKVNKKKIMSTSIIETFLQFIKYIVLIIYLLIG